MAIASALASNASNGLALPPPVARPRAGEDEAQRRMLAVAR
jgi:hypothetical protein